MVFFCSVNFSFAFFLYFLFIPSLVRMEENTILICCPFKAEEFPRGHISRVCGKCKEIGFLWFLKSVFSLPWNSAAVGNIWCTYLCRFTHRIYTYNVEEQFSSNILYSIVSYRVVRSFTVMAPVRQKICELCEEKSSKPFDSKMRQLPWEINHFAVFTILTYIHVFATKLSMNINNGWRLRSCAELKFYRGEKDTLLVFPICLILFSCLSQACSYLSQPFSYLPFPAVYSPPLLSPPTLYPFSLLFSFSISTLPSPPSPLASNTEQYKLFI